MQDVVAHDVVAQDVIGDGRSAVRSPATSTDLRTGAVRWFSPTRGYGFIAPDDGGPDVFVEQDAITMDGFRTLRVDQCVEFVPSEDDHGPIALQVRPC